MTAWRRTLPVSMYRLVNVSVKPAGSCGAWETEPGPSATAKRLDDVSIVALLTFGYLLSPNPLTERSKRGAHLLAEDLRLLPGCEVTAFVDLVEVNQVGIHL